MAGAAARKEPDNSEDRAMAFDFKKEYREFYMPKNKGSIMKY